MTREVQSGLYEGEVFHRRVRPRLHSLSYRVFYMLLDLDELEHLSRRSRVFSHNGFSLFSFHDGDHGDGSGGPLRPWVETQLARAGVEADGRISVLCFPRVLGYVFNPISIYFCHRRDGSLAAVLYEVNNTFGDRHSYLIPVGEGEGDAEMLTQACDKAFYVSPFLPVTGRYDFKLLRPGQRFALTIRESDAEGAILTASFAGQRKPFRDRDLLAAFFRHPLMTLKVVAGIHAEAAKLWRKGLRLVARPAAPASPVTIVKPAVPLRDKSGTIVPPA